MKERSGTVCLNAHLFLFSVAGGVFQTRTDFCSAAVCDALPAHFQTPECSEPRLWADSIPVNAKHCFIFTWWDSWPDKWMGCQHCRRQRWCLHGSWSVVFQEQVFQSLYTHACATKHKLIKDWVCGTFLGGLVEPYCTLCTPVIFYWVH